ncbi:EfeM/EfeO family lipoprotein, partial [Streptomyces sp. SID625]|nr:EfeM/EfeO family lipoprotein [Streptomyces sp. SID625]
MRLPGSGARRYRPGTAIGAGPGLVGLVGLVVVGLVLALAGAWAYARG